MANVIEALVPVDQRHHLPALPYAHAALEPYIDARTMQLHHGEHHAIEGADSTHDRAPLRARGAAGHLTRGGLRPPAGSVHTSVNRR